MLILFIMYQQKVMMFIGLCIKILQRNFVGWRKMGLGLLGCIMVIRCFLIRIKFMLGLSVSRSMQWGYFRYDLHFLRYQAKKTMNRESVAKLLKTCKSTNSQILIRGVFWVNGLLKSCEISLNFLINKEWLINLSHTYKYRIFSKHE